MKQGSSPGDEGEQILVDLVLQGRTHAMRRSWVNLERRALHKLGRQQGRGTDRDNLAVIAVEDQGRDIKLLEICGGVGFGEGLDAEIGGGKTGHHPLEPERAGPAAIGYG